MSHTVEKEEDSHFIVNDGRGSFRVAKKGLSDSMLAKIRGFGRKMNEGGGVDDVPVDAGVPQFGMPDAGIAASQMFGPPVPLVAPMAAPGFVAPVAAGVPAVPPSPVAAPVDPDLAAIANIKEQGRKEAEAALLPKGVRPKGAPPIGGQPAPVEPPPVSQPVARGGGGMGSVPADQSEAAMLEATRRAEEAARMQGEALSQKATQETQAIVDSAKVLQKAQLDEQDARSRAKADADTAMSRIQAAQDEFARINTKVDPGRMMASRTTGQKILAVLGLALGAFSPDGVNRAAVLLNQAIDRDIDAQKTETELALKQGRQGVETAQTIYGMQRQAAGDQLAALAASKASMLELADLRLKEIAAGAASPLAKSNALSLSAQIQQQRAQFLADAHKRKFDEAFRRDASRQGWAQIGAATTKAANPEQAKIAAESLRRGRNMLSALDEAGEIIKRSGTMELTGGDQQRLQKVLTDYAIDSAKLKDPTSAAREGEVQTELEALGVKPGAVFTSNSTAQKLIDKARADVIRRVRVAEGQ